MLQRAAALLAAAAALARSSAQSDSQCGNATAPLVAGKRNVLLIGDSISMSDPYTPGGYGVALRALLEAAGVAVQHAGGWYGGGQCSNTVKGLLCTNTSTPNNYLAIPGGGQFDVVHANWGLHDLVAACEPGQTGECEEHVDIANGDYGNNLVEIYQRFEPVTKQFIWVSTTPVPNVTTSMGRTYELAVAYNKQALDYLSTFVSGNLVVDDLWSAFIASCGAYYTSCPLQLPANVHLTKAGEAFAAQHAFASIQAAIARLEARGE